MGKVRTHAFLATILESGFQLGLSKVGSGPAAILKSIRNLAIPNFQRHCEFSLPRPCQDRNPLHICARWESNYEWLHHFNFEQDVKLSLGFDHTPSHGEMFTTIWIFNKIYNGPYPNLTHSDNPNLTQKAHALLSPYTNSNTDFEIFSSHTTFNLLLHIPKPSLKGNSPCDMAWPALDPVRCTPDSQPLSNLQTVKDEYFQGLFPRCIKRVDFFRLQGYP